MTLKEAQEVLEDWPQDLALLIFDQSKTQEFDSKKYPEISELMMLRWNNFITHLLEAARVVEAERICKLIDKFEVGIDYIKDDGEKWRAWKGLRQKILSDNQEGK